MTESSSFEDSSFENGQRLNKKDIDASNDITSTSCISKRNGWKQDSKFKQNTEESKDKASNEPENQKDSFKCAEINVSGRTISNEKTIDDTSDTVPLKTITDDYESAGKENYDATGEWNQIRLRANGTNIFNEINDTLSMTPETLQVEPPLWDSANNFEVLSFHVRILNIGYNANIFDDHSNKVICF